MTYNESLGGKPFLESQSKSEVGEIPSTVKEPAPQQVLEADIGFIFVFL